MSLLDLLYPKKCLECQKPGCYLCPNCLGKLSGLTRSNLAISVFPYKGIIRKAILALKYKYAFDIAEELATLTSTSLKRNNLRFSQNSILLPIPLHSKKEKHRGFNQAVEVGKLLAAEMNWKFIPDLLIRNKATSSQTGLDRRGRRQNVHKAFVLNTKPRRLAGNHQPLVLFDDVLTTGSTLNEAKKILEKAGFKKIYCLTIAG